MPYVYPLARNLAGLPLAGNGECVELIKKYVKGLIGISATQWREGLVVTPTTILTPGTAIATFFNGKFPREDTGQHAALWIGAAGATTFYVIEQHVKSGTIVRRRIQVPRNGQRRADGTYPNASNNALAFSVIER